MNSYLEKDDVLISLDGNPTLEYPELIILSNSMYYGSYKVFYWINLKIDTGYLTNIKNEFGSVLVTYFDISPGGIAVFGLENGLSYIKVGMEQSLDLNPLKYSYDMDFLVSMNSLDFNFYCLDIPSSMNSSNFTLDSFNLTDQGLNLKLYKTQANPYTNPCFVSPGKY